MQMNRTIIDSPQCSVSGYSFVFFICTSASFQKIMCRLLENASHHQTKYDQNEPLFSSVMARDCILKKSSCFLTYNLFQSTCFTCLLSWQNWIAWQYSSNYRPEVLFHSSMVTETCQSRDCFSLVTQCRECICLNTKISSIGQEIQAWNKY